MKLMCHCCNSIYENFDNPQAAIDAARRAFVSVRLAWHNSQNDNRGKRIARDCFIGCHARMLDLDPSLAEVSPFEQSSTPVPWENAIAKSLEEELV